MESDQQGQADWTKDYPLDDRDRKHIQFCQEYAKKWRHGAPGHIDYMLIAKLAWLLDGGQTGMYPVEPWQD